MKEINEQDFLKTFGSKTMDDLQKEVEELRKGKFDEKMKEIDKKIQEVKSELLAKINDIRNEFIKDDNEIKQIISANVKELVERINKVQEYANGLLDQIRELRFDIKYN